MIDKPTVGTANNGKFRTVVPYNATGTEVQDRARIAAGDRCRQRHRPPAGDRRLDPHSYRILYSAPPDRTGDHGHLDADRRRRRASRSAPAPTAPEALDVATIADAGHAAVHGRRLPTAPTASKIGTVRLESEAVVDHPLEGNVYLATPHQNPYDSLVGIYLVVADAQTGVFIKIPGKIETDPKTGQLTAVVRGMRRSSPSKTCASNSSRAPPRR